MDNENELYTKVELINFLNPYKGKCPQKCETIGKHILEHCIAYFVANKPPKIRVIDGTNEFNVNKYFNENLEPFSDNYEVTIKEHIFNVRGIKYYNSTNSTHKIFYCANHRTVTDEQLHKQIPNLLEGRKIPDDKGKHFIYLAFVSGDFFQQKCKSRKN